MLSRYFSDPEGESLTFTAMSDSANVTVSAVGADSTITITAAAAGTAMITITANDGTNDAVSHTLTVTVREAPNNAPVAMGQIDDQALELDFDPMKTIDVSGNFSDADDDPLMYSAASSMTDYVTASADGSMITITAVAAGSATVTVTASDGADEATATFDVTVTTPAVPTTTSELPDQAFDHDDMAARMFTLSGYFSKATMYAIAVGGDAGVVMAAEDAGVLTLTPMGPGRAVVTVTPSNSGGNGSSQTITVTVEATPVPTSIKPLQATTTQSDAGSMTIMLSEYFSGATDYDPVSNNEAVLTVAHDAGVLTLTPHMHGMATVTVTPMNNSGDRGTAQSFDVTVQARPMLKSGMMLGDMRLAVPSDPATEANLKSLDLSTYFEDPDGTIEKYSTMTDAPKTLAVYVSPRSTETGDALTAVLDKATEAAGPAVLLEARAAGTAMVTVTVTDDSGLVTTVTFEVTVVATNTAPERVGDEAIVASPGYTGTARLKLGDDPKKAIDDAEINDHFTDADLILPAGDLLTFSAKYVATGGAVDAADLDADDIVATASISPMTWDGDIGGVDKFTVTVTPTKAGAAHDILIIATDLAGAMTFKRLAVQVNQAPVAKGAVASGSTDEPGTLTKLSEDYDDLGVSTGFSTVGTSGHQVTLVADDSGYFSDADNATADLMCRFNTRGAGIFAEGYPQWATATTRRQLNLAANVGDAFEAKGTAYVDVWCTDTSGESSPMDTLTITVSSDGSIH